MKTFEVTIRGSAGNAGGQTATRSNWSKTSAIDLFGPDPGGQNGDPGTGTGGPAPVAGQGGAGSGSSEPNGDCVPNPIDLPPVPSVLS